MVIHMFKDTIERYPYLLKFSLLVILSSNIDYVCPSGGICPCCKFAGRDFLYRRIRHVTYIIIYKSANGIDAIGYNSNTEKKFGLFNIWIHISLQLLRRIIKYVMKLKLKMKQPKIKIIKIFNDWDLIFWQVAISYNSCRWDWSYPSVMPPTYKQVVRTRFEVFILFK